MATPLNVQVQQGAQQKPQDLAEGQRNKTSGRFDQAMQQRMEATQSAGHAADVQRAQATERVGQLAKVEQISRTEKASFKKVQATVSAEKPRNEPNAKGQKPDDMMPKVEHYLEQLNTSTGKIDKLISELSNNHVKLDQRQLIKMQVQVYGYSMELDLTGKIVDKATSGLKDTLKTQI